SSSEKSSSSEINNVTNTNNPNRTRKPNPQAISIPFSLISFIGASLYLNVTDALWCIYFFYFYAVQRFVWFDSFFLVCSVVAGLQKAVFAPFVWCLFFHVRAIDFVCTSFEKSALFVFFVPFPSVFGQWFDGEPWIVACLLVLVFLYPLSRLLYNLCSDVLYVPFLAPPHIEWIRVNRELVVYDARCFRGLYFLYPLLFQSFDQFYVP